MSDFITFVALGLATGSLYGLAGTGLVLTYRTSGIFNFAHGAVAAASAYIFYEMQRGGVPWPVAALICVGIVGVVAGLGLERLARALAGASPGMKIVATLGVLLAIQGVAVTRYGAEARYVRQFLPTRAVRIAGAHLGIDQLIIIVFAATASIGLAAFLRRSRLGASMRAVVDDPDLLGLAGTDPVRVRRLAWVIGSAFAAVTGILIAPSIGLDAILLTFLVVQAFGAAAIGRFSSLPLTHAGGLAIGVAAALSTRYLSGIHGLAPSMPFIALFVVLLVTPRGKLVQAGAKISTSPPPPLAPRARTIASVAGLGVALAVPAFAGARLPVFTNAAILVIVFLSMALLINESGQVSLCHAAFAALGATTFSHLTAGAGVPWLAALVIAGLAVVPLGMIVAVPASRLSGLFLALATFGLGILLERMVYGTALMFGAVGTRAAPRPSWFSSDRAFYFLTLMIALAVVAFVVGLQRGRLGRLLRAMASSPVALSTLGATIDVTRVLVFCVSAFLAGIAGALIVSLNGSVGPAGFPPLTSLLWLAVLAIGGPRVVPAAVTAAVLYAILPSYLSGLADKQAIVFGAAAVLAAVTSTGKLALGPIIERAAARATWRVERSPVRARLEAQ